MTTDLLTLQNRLKRDPMGYREEFLQQVRHFMTNLQIFKLQPLARSGRSKIQATSITDHKSGGSKKGQPAVLKDEDEATVSQNAIQSRRIQEFCALIAFLSHTANLYQNEIRELAIPQELFALLFHQTENLDPFLRKTLVQALILLQKRGLIDRNELLTALFRIFRCSDKELRKFVFSHMINDIYKLEQSKPPVTVTNSIQKIVFTMMSDDHPNVSLKAVHLLVELWKRHIWVSDRVVNAISQLCFTTNDKLISAALYFFLGEYDTSAQEEEEKKKENLARMHEIQQVSSSLKHMKRKMKKTRALDRVKKALARTEKELNEDDIEDDENEQMKKSSNMFPLKMIYDPQHFGERLFYKLKISRETFQTRMLMMEVLSHLIGLHKLLIFNFYPFIQRYLQPHQRHVTSLLTFVIRSTHPLVPPEVLGPVIKTIANQFVNDRSTPEVVSIGVNSIREICSRAPLVMTADLLDDLVQYSRHKNKGIMTATRSLINVFRELNPALLHRRQRGKEAQMRLSSLQKEGGDDLYKHQTSLTYGGEYIHRDILGAQLLDEVGLLDEASKPKTKAILKRGRDVLHDSDDEWDHDVDVDLIDLDRSSVEATGGKKAVLKKKLVEAQNKRKGKSPRNDDDDDSDDDAMDFDEFFADGEAGEMDDFFDGVGEGEFEIDDEFNLAGEGEDGEGEFDWSQFEEASMDDEDDELDEDDEDEDDEEDAEHVNKRAREITTRPEANQLVQIAGASTHIPKAAIRILTPADFKKIELLKQRKKEQTVRSRSVDLHSVLREDMDEEDERMEKFRHQNFVDIDAGELTSIRVRKEKVAREERIKFQKERKEALRQGAGNNNQIKERAVTNTEKGKATKAYSMVKFSKRVQSKAVSSFRDKQQKMGQHVKTLQNMRRNLRKKVGARGRKKSSS